MDRRSFLKKVAAAQAGALVSTAAARQTRKPADVVVIGAGAFGGWRTAYYLRQLGAAVRLHATPTALATRARHPATKRAASGHSSGNRGLNAELWSSWANRAIDRWTKFDAEWGRQMKVRLFFNTGDLIFRSAPEVFTERTQEVWKKLGASRLSRFSKSRTSRSSIPRSTWRRLRSCCTDPRAGVVRARRALRGRG